MGIVSYGSKRIIPAPLFTLTETPVKTGDDQIIGKTFTIALDGELVAFKGSPTSSGSFHTIGGYPADEAVGNTSRLAAILRKQDALRNLFATEGQSFEVQSLDGSLAFRANPRLNSIEFQEGQWYNTCKYSIVLEADNVFPQQDQNFIYPSAYLSDASESWQFDTDEQPESLTIPRHYKLVHQINAVGKRHYNDAGTLDKQPYEHARTYVQSRIGFNSNFALSSGLNNLPTFYSGYNHVRSENIDVKGGAYSATESWIITSGSYFEDFTISINEGNTAPFTSVSIAGNIQGLERRDSNMNVLETKYTNGNTQFVKASGLALGRAQAYSGKTLNIEPLTTQYSINPVAGNFSYTIEYDNRPSRLITGTRSEVVNISNTFEVDMIATIPILGRLRGPLIQDLDTKAICERSLNLELIFPVGYIPSGTAISSRIKDYNPRLHSPQSTEIASIVTAANPSGTALNNIGVLASKSRITQQTETWNPSTFQYSLNISWVYE